MKKKILIITAGILVVLLVIIISLYIANNPARDWIDKYILRKNVIEENLPNIELENENVSIYAYDNHIVVLKDNKLTIYNSSGKEETTINISISNPIFKSCGKYLLIAEQEGKSAYLIYNAGLQWHKTMEGNISKVTVNKNGAVGIALTGTTHKTVITMYGATGVEEFKIYLSSTIAVDLEISEDNKYLSFAEINTSGTILSSVVKTISVEKAKTIPSEAIIYKYEDEKNSLIVNIKYNKDKLICQYDNAIYSLKDGNSNKILDIDEKITFIDIHLLGYICNIVENPKGILNNEYELKIINSENNRSNDYLLKSIPKSLYCSESIIAVNMGNELEFINHSGWLLKSFTSRQNFKDIVLGDSIIGIIYKDRIDIINI